VKSKNQEEKKMPEPVPAPPEPTPTPDPTPAPTPDPTPTPPEFKVPEKYAKEKWASNITNPDVLWDQFANAQTLIGRKTIPGENAKPEEIAEFHKALGVPDNAEGYEFKVIEPLKDRARDAEIDNVAKSLLKKHGIPKKAGESFVHDFEMAIFEKQKPALEKATEMETAFNAMKLATFGEKADVAMNQFKDVLKTSLKDQPQLVGKLDELPNEQFMTLMAFAKKIHDTYVGEHKLKPGGTPPASADVKTQYQQLSQAKLQVKQDANLPPHIRDAKLVELNRQMRQVGEKARDAGIDLFS
jgi:hypothetical protein